MTISYLYPQSCIDPAVRRIRYFPDDPTESGIQVRPSSGPDIKEIHDYLFPRCRRTSIETDWVHRVAARVSRPEQFSREESACDFFWLCCATIISPLGGYLYSVDKEKSMNQGSTAFASRCLADVAPVYPGSESQSHPRSMIFLLERMLV